MAKSLVSVDTLLESHVTTGLTGEAYEAFVQFCRSEYGAFRQATGADDAFSTLRLSGKGDKAKAKLNRGSVEVKGSVFHNTAFRVLAGACAIRDIEETVNGEVGKLDAREVCAKWETRWREKQVAKASENNA